MSWQNAATQVPQGDHKAMFPFIQWVNNGQALDPREMQGGFAMPEEQMELAKNYPAGAVMHNLFFKQGGDPTAVAYSPTVTVAVLATRFAWVQGGDFVPAYVKGARGKLQALCVIGGEVANEGQTAFVAVLTFTGKSGQAFSEALKAHRQRVAKATAKAGQKAPASIFYATYQAGTPRLEGQGTEQSLVTPVELAPGEFDPDTAYIGEAALALVDWNAVEEWRKAWENPKGPNGDGEVGHGDDRAVPAPAAGDPPVAAVQYPAALPFKSTKYPQGTIQTLFAAGDEAALRATVQWCAANPGHPAVQAQAEQALQALQPAAPAIPF